MKRLCFFDEFALGERDESIKLFLANEIDYDRSKVVLHLEKGKKIASCPKAVSDPLIGKNLADSFRVLSDGTFYWIDVLPYFIKHYNIRLPESFLRVVDL